MKVPQECLTSPEGFATSNIKDGTVVAGRCGDQPGRGDRPGGVCPVEDGLTLKRKRRPGRKTWSVACPTASQVGTAQSKRRCCRQVVEGHVYVLQSEPPHVRLLVAAAGEGV